MARRVILPRFERSEERMQAGPAGEPAAAAHDLELAEAIADERTRDLFVMAPENHRLVERQVRLGQHVRLGPAAIGEEGSCGVLLRLPTLPLASGQLRERLRPQ